MGVLKSQTEYQNGGEEAWLPKPSRARRLIIARFAVLLSIALYVASCRLPALMLHTGGDVYGKDLKPNWRWQGHESLLGVELLLTGWFGLMMGNFAVLANPALWLSWLLLWTRHNRGATMCALAALAFAIFTFELSVRPYYFDEAGVKLGYLESLEMGFVCWLASMVVIAASRIWLGEKPRVAVEP